MLDSRPFDVVATLAPVRRRLSLERVGRWSTVGVGVGAGAGAVFLLLARAWSLDLDPTICIVAVLVGGLAGAAVGMYRRPTLLEAARAADGYFGLHDRLTTALDYRSSEDAFPAMQRADVARRLRGLMLEQSGHGEMTWRRSAFPAIAILALVALLLIGMPPSSPVVVKAKGGEGQRIRSVAATQVPAVLQNLERGLTPQERKGVAVRKLEHTLTRLQHQLQRTSNRPAALRAISLTQQQLRRLAASLHPINSQAVAQMNHSLQQYMPRQQRDSSMSGDRSASAGAKALARLARALNHLSAAQRAQLTRSLAQAARESPDRGLRNALAKAASALASGNSRSAAQALNRASAALGQSARTSATQSQLNATDSQLDSLKNSVSGFGEENPSSEAGAQSGSAGQNQISEELARQRLRYKHGEAPGNSLGGRSSNGSGARNGSSGIGKGNGKNQGAGSGSGEGQGQGQGTGQTGNASQANAAYTTGHGLGANGGGGGKGTQGTGGGRGGAGKSGQAQYVTVYIPGVQGKGAHRTQIGPSGSPTRKSLVPYRLVIAKYSRSAHTALDRSDLPPDLRSYIRDYFASVSQ